MSVSTPFSANLSQVIFERSADYPSGLLAPSIFLIVAFGFLILAFLRRKPIEAQLKFLQNNTSVIPKPPLCLKIAGFIAIFGLAGGVPQVWGWWTLRQDLQQEKITVVEGVLTKAETWQTKGRRTSDSVSTFELIEVAGKEISYQSNEVGAPFPLVAKNGGVLIVGKPVRLTFAGDAIIRIETQAIQP